VGLPLRRSAGFLAAGVALACAGCGGSAGGTGGGDVPASASRVPATAPLYVYADTDLAGGQWTKLQALAAKFPDRDLLLARIRTALAKQKFDLADVRAAIGSEIGLALPSFDGGSGVLLLTQPTDAVKFRSLLHAIQSPPYTIDGSAHGWTIAAQKQQDLDAARAVAAGHSLADRPAFRAAMSRLPADALLKVYVDEKAAGRAILDSVRRTGLLVSNTTPAPGPAITGSLVATDDGLELEAGIPGKTKRSGPGAPYAATLPSEVPGDVFAFASFDGDLSSAASQPGLNLQLAPLTQILGVSPAKLFSLFTGEGALYVRTGSPIPEVTLVLAEKDPQTALATLDGFATQAAARFGSRVEPTEVDGIAAKRLTVQRVQLYYAAFDGKLVVTDSTTGISGLKDDGPKLADDARFRDAAAAAAMPDETTGFFYVNVPQTVSLIESFASIAGQSLPSKLDANLRPVRSLLAFGTAADGTFGFKAFLQVK
jgi:hypothetical protein